MHFGPPVKLILVSEEAIRLEPTPGPLVIEGSSDDQSFSPFHMMAGGLATCSYSVLYTWAMTAGLSADDLSLEVGWTFVEDPYRIGEYTIRFDWPSLPEERIPAAKRVVEKCTIHATFHHPPKITLSHTSESELTPEHSQADGVETTG